MCSDETSPTDLTRRDTAPLTLLDLIVIVTAAGFSAGMAVRSESQIPLAYFPGENKVDAPPIVIYGFAGLLGCGPIIQGLQFLRIGRRHWTVAEWTWTVSGASFGFLPILDNFASAHWTRLWEISFALTSLVFYYFPGPIVVVFTVRRLIRSRVIPWSAWVAQGVLVLWSGLWWCGSPAGALRMVWDLFG